ncbi:MAG: polysaccharide pyruvyl transferase CsaB [Acidobacteriota bacterium]
MSGRGLLICGYYGFGNAGDEAILAAMISHLRCERPDLALQVISGDPTQTAAMHRVEAVHWQDVVAINQAVTEAGLVVIGGGGLFHDHWGVDPETVLTPDHWGISYPTTVALLALLARRPLMLYAIGVGPLVSEAARRLTLSVCEGALVITLRDSASLELLGSLGVTPAKLRLAADPAFALEAGGTGRSREPGTISVSLRNWDRNADPARWTRVVAQALDRVVEASGSRVVFVPFQQLKGEAEDDAAICDRVAALMTRPAAVRRDLGGPGEILDQLASADVVLAMRLHAVILAARVGVPAVALSYDPKVESAMNQLGWASQSCGLAELEATSLSACLLDARANRDQLVARAQQRLPGLAALARSSAGDALRLLDHGQPAPPSERTLAQLADAADTLIRRHATLTRLLFDEREHTAASLRDARTEVEEVTASLGRAERALGDTRAEVEQLNAQVEDLDTQTKRLDLELSRERADLAQARIAAEHAAAARDEAISRLEAESHRAVDLERRLQAAGAELASIHHSRLWRIGSVYWRLLERVGRLPHGGPDRGAVATAATAVDAEAEAPSAGPKGGARTAGEVTEPPSIRPAPGTGGLPPVPSAGYDVVVFSIIDFDFRFQRPQQLATQFARHGHRVFYLSIARLATPSEHSWELVRIADNLAELRLAAGPFDIYGGALRPAETERLEAAFASLAGHLAIGDAVALLQLPFWWPIARRLRERLGWRVVYDCMDEWNNFPGFGSQVLELEEGLVREADVTVVSADRLVAKHGPAARRLVLAKNGVDLDHYRPFYGPNELLGDVRHPIVGYFGALASWVDVALLEKIARALPDVTLVLAGGQFDIDLSAVSALANVRLLGQRPYDEIPALLWNFDVCMIPFLVNEITEATNPVKFYEYLFSGKAVVAPRLTELLPYEDVSYLAADHEGFIAGITRALAEEPGDPRRNTRREIAAANDWSDRYAVIDAGVREAFPLVSVVVVCYGGIELTQECLESLLEGETWPRLEVIAVDNASPDGTAEYLRNLERRDPRVHTVLNDENRGFAVANNQGLSLARGEFLVLLNNDTVAPPGLLGRLVGHLNRDLSIGLLCPTTNFCGNEAKVDADYAGLRGLPAFAARRAQGYAGQTFELETAAMYCVALRREVLEKVGPLDEAYGVGMFEDDDYSRRIKLAGFRVACAEDAYVHHVGQSAFAKLPREEYEAIWKRNQAYFEAKWGVSWKPHVTRAGVARAEPKIR